jgi:hypothetical protein
MRCVIATRSPSQSAKFVIRRASGSRDRQIPVPPQRSRAHEGKQVLVEGVGIDLGEAVAAALVDLQLRALDDLRSPWTTFAVFSAEAAIGTIWSSSPWMTSVGLSIFLRSVV